MSIYAIYLGRVSNLNKFAIGTPVLNRANFAEKNTTGMFINTVPLKINIDNQSSFVDFVKSIAKNSMGLLRHQKYTYQQLLNDLRTKSNSSSGLYDFLLSYQVTKANNQKSSIPYEIDWLPNSTIGDGIYVHIHDNNDSNCLNIDYDYQIDKYSEKDIKNIHSRILYIINQTLSNDNIALKNIEIITPTEKEHILNDFNNTKADYPKNKTIAKLFEEQVKKTPNNTALVFENNKLTYKQLNEKANSLAYYLRSQKIGKNDLIGIMANRSLEMIVSILAVLKAGGAYIPIDPTYPQNRIEYMLNSSNAKILLTQKKLDDKIEFKNKLFVDLDNKDIYKLPSQDLKIINTPDDLAYVIFTSGSTGMPKGVMLMQKNIVNFIFGMMNEFKFSDKTTIASITTISFDIFVLESLMPLLNGLKTVIANENEQTNVKLFNKLCVDNKVDVIQTTPSRMMSFMVDTEGLDFVRNATHILIGGEPFPATLLKKFKEITKAKIYNMYGPTETAVWSSLKHLKSPSEITVGLPIANTQFYILDKNLNVMPTHTPGDLYISGDGVCKGYLNRDDLTKKSFIPNPFVPGTIMYNTGDLGMYQDNGEIVCMGRSDFQVKIRGLRLELGEIEDKISEITEIKSCAVVKWVNSNSHEYLCAYYTSDTNIESSYIRNYIAKFLPSYMIPECFIRMEVLPHTPNGKTDKKALPEPKNDTIQNNIVPPRNDIDIELLEIFKKLLKLDNISIDSSFFELGGDSLSAISLSINIQNIFKCELYVKDILEYPSVQELSDIISKNKNTIDMPEIKKAEKKEFYPVSYAQKRIYFASQASGNNSTLYNISGGVLLDGKIDINLLENCLKALINRHESLRTYFEVNDENVVQKIKEEVDFNLDIIKAADVKYLDNIFKDFVRPFDLNKAPLFRARYIQLIDKKSVLLIDMHHIISDGKSLNIFIDELCKLYNGKTLTELNISYKDFSVFENQMINDGKLDKAEEFWLRQFEGEIPLLNMPTNYPRPAVKSYEGKRIYLNLDLNLTKTIERLCKELGITPYMLLLSCYYILLSKYTSQDDIIIGSPIIGRNLPQTENLIGMFVNTLAIKEHIDSSLSIKDFMLSLKDNLLEIYKYQSYPFDKLVNSLNIKRDSSRNPLFDIMFVYQNDGFNDVNFGDIKSEFYIPDTGISKFDLTLEAIPNKTGMVLSFEYAIQLFNEDFINDLSKHYLNVLNIILKNVDTKISDICILSNEEKNQILFDFNNTKTDIPKDKTIAEIFEKQVKNNPNNTAVIFENKKITYKELNEKANSLANHFIKLGITNNDTISILLNRSFDLIIAIYAVIKSGASYVLIDSTFPKDRINYIISNSNSKYCIVNNLSKNQLDADNYINIDTFDYSKFNNKNVSTKSSSNLCYIYTSGSTGNPKGVSLHQIGFINLIYAFDKVMEISKAKNILGISTVSFDMFAVELFSPLFFGNTLVLANEEEQKNVIKMSQLIKEHNIEFFVTTPSRVELLLLEECDNPLVNVKAILLGGEKLSSLLFEKIHKATNARIFNGYGPTEISACCSIKEVTSSDITIGKPLSNTEIYICDSNLNLLPVGITGEICVGGIGVANGYLNNKTATEKAFLKNPFREGLLYRTGDLGRYRNNGEIEFIGRSDFQIKIRGLRIELEEIENRILEISGIDSCIVTKKTDDFSREFLCSYYKSNLNITANDLRKALAHSLPQYMIPSYFVKIAEWPYSHNGKINIKTLPDPQKEPIYSNISLPRNEIDSALIETLKNILKINQISIDDSFFELGGDSLSAINLAVEIKSRFKTEILVREILENPTVKELSDKISMEIDTTKNNIIKKAPESDYYPISTAQKRMFYTSKIAGNSSVLYNAPEGVIFSKKVDIDKIENCINMLISRHESLRTYFVTINDSVVQKIADNIKFNLEIIRAADFKYIDNIFKYFVQPFDLSKAPLFRAEYIEFTNGKSALFIDIHHIIFDGKSISIFIDELEKLYNGETLPELSLTYKDYAVFENNRMISGDMKESEEYWLHKFEGEIPVLDIPTTYSRPAIQSFDGKKIYSSINQNMKNKIENISHNLGITPYMLLLSAYYILLSKYTSNEDIIIGSPVVGRDFADTYNIIGMFVNTLALRQKIDTNLSFKGFALQVKENLLNSYKYQTYPFDELVRKLNLKRDPSRNPLFDTMFIYQNNGFDNIKLDDIKAEYYLHETNTSKFDLSIEIVPNENGFLLSFEYATKLFNDDFIQNLSKHYLNILNNVIEDINTKIFDINMLSNDEKNKILYEFNNTSVDYNKNKHITELFEEQVQKTPDNIAIIFENKQITYKELNEKANSLAFYLRENGIGRNDLVGILVNRSIEMIIAILAVLKAGGAYIPIDPTYPQERIEYMLNSSNAKILLTQNKLDSKVSFGNKIFIDLSDKNEIYTYSTENLTNINTPEDLFYVIFTSGSTGRPKGVMITHKTFSNFTNYCNHYVEYLKNASYATILSITTISFDIFAFETIISLQKGLKVVIANENEQTTPSLLNNLIEKNNVTITQTTPSIMQLFVNNLEEIPLLKNIKYLTLAGEQLPIDLVHKIHEIADTVIYNGYGPSETYYVTLTKMNDEFITIGKPIDNTQIYILDKYLKPVPIGSTGELYMSGDCVAKGYLNNENLTNASFIPNPFISGTIMYKSGDLGKYMDDGNIICLGRSDHQIKIRGQRIEPGEIETLIAKFPNIKNVTVVKQSIQSREFISAYFISTKKIIINELRKYLSNSLPRYMVPTYFIAMEEFPYTLNGKIDKKALPLPKEILNISQEEYVAPRTELQSKLVNIWQEILNTKPIGINDNFFELGGDSILAMSLNIELLKISAKITYSDIFRYPTIAEQAEKIMSNDETPMFSKIENLSDNFVNILENNVKKDTIQKRYGKNILLTGGTGFLGIHLLEQFVKNDSGCVYCIVRDEPGVSANTKLHQKLNYYFGNKYDELIGKKIFAITGNISEPGFGLNQEELLKLANSVDIVINSAARVAHYGNYNDFYNSNVRSVRYIIDFCNSFNKTLYHISTIGISDVTLDSSMLFQNKKRWVFKNTNNNVIFDESSLYIGQNLNNVYTRSKFEAESYVLNAISQGLDGYILRMGNLMSRYSDGVFQENILDNAFVNKLLAFTKIGIIPDYLLNTPLEFTPVDYAAKASYTIITHPSSINRVFHLYNHKTIPTKKYIQLLKHLNYNIQVLNEKDFKNKLNIIIQDENSKNLLNNLLNDFNKDLHLEYKSDIIIKSNFTIKYLKKLHFRWPNISNKYLIKFINLLKKVM